MVRGGLEGQVECDLDPRWARRPADSGSPRTCRARDGSTCGPPRPRRWPTGSPHRPPPPRPPSRAPSAPSARWDGSVAGTTRRSPFARRSRAGLDVSQAAMRCPTRRRTREHLVPGAAASPGPLGPGEVLLRCRRRGGVRQRAEHQGEALGTEEPAQVWTLGHVEFEPAGQVRRNLALESSTRRAQCAGQAPDAGALAGTRSPGGRLEESAPSSSGTTGPDPHRHEPSVDRANRQRRRVGPALQSDTGPRR